VLSVCDAMDDSHFLADLFSGSSWEAWRAIWRAAQGEAHLMTPRQREIFAEIAQREPPTSSVREVWVAGGRRGGKDSTTSAVLACAGAEDYRQFCRPGESPAIVCLAVDRDQAKITLNYTREIFRRVPMLRELVASETKDGLELTNGNEIFVATNSFRSIRGRAIVAAVFGECAFWRDDSSATPDTEVYRAVLPGMSTIPNAMLIGISSPYRRQGLLYDRFVRSFGKPDPRVLFVKASTAVLNPTIDPAIIAEAMEDDAAAARSEYMAEWRDDISSFVDRAAVEDVVDTGAAERPPLARHEYDGFLDAAGGSGQDDMSIAIAHTEDGIAVLDCVRWISPPFSPKNVVAEFSSLCKSYRIHRLTADKWGSDFVVEAFREHGITVEQSAKPKSSIYLELLPLINSGSVRLLSIPKLINQLCGLERRTARGGRDSIDHAPNAHDDLANAAAGVLVSVAINPNGFNLAEYIRAYS
jgi:hypothetical protein